MSSNESQTWTSLVEQDNDGLVVERILPSQSKRSDGQVVAFLISQALRTRYIYREDSDNLAAVAFRNGVRVGLPITDKNGEEGLSSSAILIQPKDSERVVRSLRLVLGHLMSPIPERPALRSFLLTESRNGFRTEFSIEGELITVQRTWNPSLADEFVTKMKAKGHFQEIEGTENDWLYVIQRYILGSAYINSFFSTCSPCKSSALQLKSLTELSRFITAVAQCMIAAVSRDGRLVEGMERFFNFVKRRPDDENVSVTRKWRDLQYGRSDTLEAAVNMICNHADRRDAVKFQQLKDLVREHLKATAPDIPSIAKLVWISEDFGGEVADFEKYCQNQRPTKQAVRRLPASTTVILGETKEGQASEDTSSKDVTSEEGHEEVEVVDEKADGGQKNEMLKQLLIQQSGKNSHIRFDS